MAHRQKRFPLAYRYPRVKHLQDDLGMRPAEIAKRLRISRESVYRILRYGAQLPEGSVMIPDMPSPIRDPIPYEKLDPQVQALLEPTADAFEAFYNRYNPEWTLPAHCKEFVRRALGKRRVVLNVPPGHAKSSTFSMWFVIWQVCRNRDIQILLLSKTDRLAKEFCRYIELQLRENDKLTADFGRFHPEDQSAVWSPGTGQLSVAGRNTNRTHGPTILSRGALQQVYGFRFDLVIADDVVDGHNSKTPELREEMVKWFHQIVLSRLRPGKPAIVIGTRFNIDDLYGVLVEKESESGEARWEHINFPAILDEEQGLVLWPEEWTLQRLQEIRDDDPIIFAETYQQEPLPKGARIVQPEWMQDAWDDDRSWGPRKQMGARVISLDPSPSRYAGLIVADVVQTQGGWRIDVLEATSQRMSVRDMLQELDRLAQVYQPNTLIIEVNAAQRWFLQDKEFEEFRKKWGIRVIPHTTGINKTDRMLGSESLGNDFAAGRIRLPGADQNSRQAMRQLVTECLSAYVGQKNDRHGRMDLFMALWFIKFNVKSLIRIRSGIAGRITGRHIPPRLQGRKLPGFRRSA